MVKCRTMFFCKLVAGTVLLCFLPACDQGLDHLQARLRPANFNEARLVDISFPLGVELQELKQKEENKSAPARYSVSFETGETVEALFSFYQSEMERLGWQMISTFWLADKSLTLLFERPSKVALISVVTRSKKQLVTCHVSRRGSL